MSSRKPSKDGRAAGAGIHAARKASKDVEIERENVDGGSDGAAPSVPRAIRSIRPQARSKPSTTIIEKAAAIKEALGLDEGLALKDAVAEANEIMGLDPSGNLPEQVAELISITEKAAAITKELGLDEGLTLQDAVAKANEIMGVEPSVKLTEQVAELISYIGIDLEEPALDPPAGSTFDPEDESPTSEPVVPMTQGARLKDFSILSSFFACNFRRGFLIFSAVSAGGSYELGLIPGVNCRSFTSFQIRSAKRLPQLRKLSSFCFLRLVGRRLLRAVAGSRRGPGRSSRRRIC